MQKHDYMAMILVKATENEAFKNINNVAAWWTENIEGRSEKLNDVFTTHFGEAFVTMKIVESVRDKKVVWNVTDCYLHWLADKKEWKDTRIVFEISTEGDSARIQFMHVGLVPEVECYDNCVKGWDQYIKDSLAKLINEGKGLPQRKQIATAEPVN
ncbi:MAG: SRPBCC domain-containing protein [Chitinophagaceae bacterium]